VENGRPALSRGALERIAQETTVDARGARHVDTAADSAEGGEEFARLRGVHARDSPDIRDARAPALVHDAPELGQARRLVVGGRDEKGADLLVARRRLAILGQLRQQVRVVRDGREGEREESRGGLDAGRGGDDTGARGGRLPLVGAIDQGDPYAVPRQAVGGAGANDPAADDHDIVHGQCAPSRSIRAQLTMFLSNAVWLCRTTREEQRPMRAKPRLSPLSSIAKRKDSALRRSCAPQGS